MLIRCSCLILMLGWCGVPALARDCVGVVPSGGGASYWGKVEAGARQAASELGLDLYYRGPTREGDTAAQLKVIDKLLAHGCKAVVIAPAGMEMGERAAQLREQGVPMLYIDRDMGGAAVQGVIATNNFQAGVLAGEQMVSALQGKGRIALVRLDPQVVSTSQREQGFMQAVQAADLEIVFDQYLGNHGAATLVDLRKSLPQVDGIFTANASSSAETLAALKRDKLAGQRVHIGFDSNPVLLEALQQGEMYGLVVQQPFAMGYQAVMQAQRLLQGGEPAAGRVMTDLPVVFVSRANVHQPEIIRLVQELP